MRKLRQGFAPETWRLLRLLLLRVCGVPVEAARLLLDRELHLKLRDSPNLRSADLAPMKEDNACVPVLLLCGGTLGDRDAAIARLVKPLAAGQSIAVLRAGSGMFASPAAPFGPHVVMKWAPIGCVCCTAGVIFRVAMLQLLRASHPARLVVDLGPGAHVATLEAELQGQSLARLLQVVERVDLDAQGSHAVSWPA
jgi:hypothetical protein